jgi:tRNA threonylcarbamoyladenosine biosynthesis protein TsaE
MAERARDGRTWTVRSRSPESTEELGERLGRVLRPGSVLGLVGELGSGKTTLVRGLARGLECTDPVTSPTFTRMRELSGRLPLYHFDAWRSGSEPLFAEGGELLGGEGVAVVEWADRVEAWLPRPRIEIRLAHAGVDEREIALALVGARPGAEGLERDLARAVEAAVSGREHV